MALPLTRSAASDAGAGTSTCGTEQSSGGEAAAAAGSALDDCARCVHERATNGGKGGPGVRPRRCTPRACLVVFAALASAIEGAAFGAPSAARAVGAPLLVAAAAGVRVTVRARPTPAARARRSGGERARRSSPAHPHELLAPCRLPGGR